MTDSTPSPLEARLRRYLDDERRRAETDFRGVRPVPPAVRRGAGVLGTVMLATLLIATFAIIRTLGTTSPPGADVVGPDGFPLTLGGVDVLRGGALDTRMSATDRQGSFLAGGYLVLHGRPCQAPCSEDWRIDDLPSGAGDHSVQLVIGEGASPLVRTSGAPTVLRASVGVVAGGRAELIVEAVAWRNPTRGPLPAGATLNGRVELALVPDFVSVLGGPTGQTIVGYAPKERLLNASQLRGSPNNPPQPLPVPVYGDDLTTLVGHVVPDHRFVPIGSSLGTSGLPGGAEPSH
jgi:hypothetical protein